MRKTLSVLFLCLCFQLTGNQIDTWSSPTTLSTSGVDSSSAVVSMDSSGNAVAVWVEGSVVVSKDKLLNMSWSSATTLSSTGASQPQLVVDPAGNATAIWVESGVVKARTKPFGSAWGSTTTLSGASSSSPQIAVDPSGNVVAVWVASGGIVNSKTKLFGMSWSVLPDVLSLGGSANPQVYISSNGKVVALWDTLNGVTSTYNVNSATKSIAGLWGAAALVSDPALDSRYPKLCMDSSGNALAVWYSYELTGNVYSNVTLQSSSLPNAGSWATPVNVSEPGMRNPANLLAQVILSNDGNAVVVWTNSYNGSNFFIESAFGNLQLNWSPTVTIIDSLYAYSIDFTINSIGDALAVYMTSDTNSSPILIKYIESHAGGLGAGAWTNPVTISSGNSDSFPQIASTLSGTDVYAEAVWANYDGMNTVIQSSFGTGTAVLPPSNLAVSQLPNNFGTFIEYENVLSWTASTDPNVVGYEIYRNGEILGFVTAATLQFTDSNAVQSGAVTYGVSAFDNSGTESNVVTVSFP